MNELFSPAGLASRVLQSGPFILIHVDSEKAVSMLPCPKSKMTAHSKWPIILRINQKEYPPHDFQVDYDFQKKQRHGYLSFLLSPVVRANSKCSKRESSYSG